MIFILTSDWASSSRMMRTRDSIEPDTEMCVWTTIVGQHNGLRGRAYSTHAIIDIRNGTISYTFFKVIVRKINLQNIYYILTIYLSFGLTGH